VDRFREGAKITKNVFTWNYELCTSPYYQKTYKILYALAAILIIVPFGVKFLFFLKKSS